MSVVKGWCPGALRPMESSDGWVVRLRPPGGRLSRAQAAGIARAARLHGNGRIDLTGRANLQLRGITADSHAPLLAELRALALIDPDIATETRHNIVVTPFADAETDRIAADLRRALAASDLALPAKFGFAVDTGPAPGLTDTPADIRLERDAGGGPILRADGMAHGQRLGDPAQAVALAAWFLDRGGAVDGRGRMGALIARGIVPDGADIPALAPVAAPGPGPCAGGFLAALEFGQIEAALLATVARLGPLRLTPWRMLLIEGASALPDLPGLIGQQGDPRLRLRACPGAPACPAAFAPTRDLARRLMRTVPPGAILHVSGCAKGCGWPRRADLTLTATPDGFDLIRGGRAGDTPDRRGLDPDRLTEVP
ncbi:precorrin-3B synthase [Paracoccus stylophorae]|uniref:Precorrin-3B synthase n=1 Tax=Paracoccus stylophorae TaxID=659350 RepID=A0ABY7SVW0_9RHOB|nr:precorrin-3B synthase [Paracoccus stylophorae]WCR11165.1 precorrin-3B synthase [Paracoccus stylophorae]